MGSYYKVPNTKIYFLEIEDQGIGEEVVKINILEVVTSRSYVCKALARPSRNKKVPPLVLDFKKNQIKLEKVYIINMYKADQNF